MHRTTTFSVSAGDYFSVQADVIEFNAYANPAQHTDSFQELFDYEGEERVRATLGGPSGVQADVSAGGGTRSPVFKGSELVDFGYRTLVYRFETRDNRYNDSNNEADRISGWLSMIMIVD